MQASDAPSATERLDALNPPTIPQPTFAPPTAQPSTDGLMPPDPWASPARVSDTKKVLSRSRVLGSLALVAIVGLGVGAVAQTAGKSRIERQLKDTTAQLTQTSSALASTDSDLKKVKSEADSLRARLGEMQSEKNTLEDRNDTLAEFGATVATLVDDLDACVDGHEQFINDLADGDYWSSGRISNLVVRCNAAQDQAADLDDLLTS